MATAPFIATLALVGVVIIVASLLTGVVDRWRVPQVALFLLLGLALGPSGLALVDFSLASPVLQSVAVLALVLVLFTDAVGVDVTGVRRDPRLAFLVLGPGTLLSAALIAVAAKGLLGLDAARAAILGAALASTDPVLMRGLLRGTVPAAARQVLSLESGLNDIVLLPVVLIAMSLIPAAGGPGLHGMGRMVLDVFLLGPGAGIAIGFVGVAVLDRFRRTIGVRRDYESLYALGVAFTAYAAAEAMHASGFLAVFAAGLTIAAVDAELCDCFLDFGQAAAEMFLLFTFVAFGTSLIWTGLEQVTWQVALFAVIALAVRSVVLAAALARTALDARSRRLIVWYGPRGLSSLLLVLLPVFAGVPGAADLFAPAALVVLLSVVLHGGSLVLLAGPARKGPPRADVDSPPAPGGGGPAQVADRLRITLDEVRRLQQSGEPVVFLDVRKERDYRDSDARAKGALRVPPDGAAAIAAELALPKHAWLVAYCA